MLLPRRISEKKCRFTAKKITFLEYQRVKRLELTKNITERKRLGTVLFIPDGVEQSNSLSHESIQKILHQGSLFHSVKTNFNSLDNYTDNTNDVSNHFNTLCNIKENNLKDSIKGSLNDLLYGRILNVRCLNNHDLCILVSYLINLSEFSDIKCSLLLKVLEQINLKFNTLSISEISHILYNINQLNKLTDKYKIFMDLCCSIVNRTTRFLFNGTVLNNINFVSSSNVSKILYTLTHWNILDLNLDFKQLLKVYLNYLDSNKPNAREYSLICKSMVKLNSPDYDILKIFSDYYYHQILQFNLNINTNNSNNNSRDGEGELSRDKEEIRGENGDCSNDNISSNLNMLYCFDKMDEKIDLDNLFVLLETNEYFGVNHSKLLNEFDRYITVYLNIFTKNTGILTNMYNRGNNSSNSNKENKNKKESKKKKMLINMLKNDSYLKNNKLNLQKIYSELSKMGLNNDHLWSLEVIKKIGRYVNKRHLFKKYVMAINIDNNKNNNNKEKEETKNNNKDNSTRKVDKTNREKERDEDLMRGFIEAIGYLPKVINYNNIWKIFKSINECNRVDLVPVFYSYLSESSIVFDDLEEPSDDLYEIFTKVIKNKSENYLVELDNICKIVEKFCECDLNRDYIGVKMFCNMFDILVLVNRLSCEEFNEFDSCGSLSFVKKILENYFEKYLKVKVLEFESIPKGEGSYKMLRFISEMKECRNIDDMMELLENFRKIEGFPDKVIGLNIDVFKFVIYNGFMNKIKEF